MQRKKKYYANRTLSPTLVEHYFRNFGNVQKVLDLGCGLGCLGRLKPKAMIEVYGLDIDENAVLEASNYENAKTYDLEKNVLPYDNDYFDGVLARDILEHLQFPWVMLSEVYRVIKPGGLVIASVPMAKPSVVWNDYTHVRGFTHSALKMLFEDSNFKIIYVKKMGAIPMSGKLHMVRWIPIILSFPPMDYFWGNSLEIKARKPVRNS